MRRLLSALLAATLVVGLAACTTSTSTSPSSAPAPVPVAATERALATVGIATVADESSSTPLTSVTGTPVFSLTTYQMDNLARGAAAGAGATGAALDETFPMPTGSPPIAYLIGAWVSLRSDPAQRLAAAVYGAHQPDWHHADQAVFPTEVIALFVADFVRAARTPATDDAVRTDGAKIVEISAPSSGVDLTKRPCSSVQGMIVSGLQGIFSALKLDPAKVYDWVHGTLGGGVVGRVAGTIASVAASIWNRAVSFFESSAEALLKQITAPIIGVLQFVLGGLATYTLVVSYLQRQTAPTRADPPSNVFAHGAEADRTGTVTVDLSDGPASKWPKFLVDCASSVDVGLPQLSKPGMPVTWTSSIGSPTLLTIAPTTEQTLKDDLTSSVTYTTGRESDDVAAHGLLQYGPARVAVSVRRSEIGDLKDFIVRVLVGRLPGGEFVQSLVAPIVRSLAEMIAKQFDTLTSVLGSTTVWIGRHVPKPVPPCTGRGIPDGTYAGAIDARLAIAMHVPTGPAAIDGTGDATISGPMRLVVAGGRVSGSWRLTGTSTGHVLGFSETRPGHMTGALDGTASAPTVRGTLSDGTDTVSYRGSLHVTGADCASVSGDIVPVFRDIYRQYGTTGYITIGGSGGWRVRRAKS